MSLSHAHIILSTGWNLGIFSLFLLSISCILLVSALRGVSRTLIISNLFCQRCCSSGANRKCWKTRGKDYWTRHVSDGVYYWPVGRNSTLEKKKKKKKNMTAESQSPEPPWPYFWFLSAETIMYYIFFFPKVPEWVSHRSPICKTILWIQLVTIKILH